jgi:hypothetical protein
MPGDGLDWSDEPTLAPQGALNEFSISHLIFFIASAYRLESGLVRLARRGTRALSKRRLENFLDDEKWKILNEK